MIEITSYVLGMLTIAAVLLLIALVLGMVKISKLEKTISEHQKQFDIVYENMSRNDEHLRRLLDDTHRDINMVEKTIMNQVQQIDQEHHKIEDAIHREIDQTKSYIDSRIDKVVATGTLKSSKEIIKG
jgi:peptidoglycan hydrolase CwlO-like protein